MCLVDYVVEVIQKTIIRIHFPGQFWAGNTNPSGELVASFAGNNLDQSKKI